MGVGPTTTALATQCSPPASEAGKGLATPGNPRCTDCCTNSGAELSPEVKRWLEVLAKLPLATRARIAAQLLSGDDVP